TYGESASLEYPVFIARPGCLGTGRKLAAERAEILSRNGYRVVLSGIGGDEFLGGNPDPRGLLADLLVQFKLISLAKQVMAWSLVKRGPWLQLLWQSALTLLPAWLAQCVLKEARPEPWIEKDFAKRTRLAMRQLDVGEHFGLWLPTRRSYIAGVLIMANRMAEHGTRIQQEVRYPYLDQDLIEFVLSIPASQLLR